MRAAAALFDHRKAVYDIGRAVGHWAWNVQRSGSREGE
jgi:hypothetical protein